MKIFSYILMYGLQISCFILFFIYNMKIQNWIFFSVTGVLLIIETLINAMVVRKLNNNNYYYA
jgi:hypothetical protein